MAGADGHGQTVAAALFHECLGLVGVGQHGVLLINLDVFLHAAQHTQFRLDADALGVGARHHAAGDGHVFGERLVGGVDHHRAIEAGIDAVVAGLLVAVIQVDGKDGFGIFGLHGADDGLQHAGVGVFARPLAELDDERGLGLDVALEQAERLLHVIDVVRADGVVAVGFLE